MPRIRVAGVILQEDNIVLVKHRRLARSYFTLPGGKVAKGETIEACLQRHIQEETHLEVEPVRLLYVADVIAPWGQRHSLNLIFLCKVVGGELREGKMNDPRRRFDETLLMPLEELPSENFYPPVTGVLHASWEEDFETPTLYLGNLWCETKSPAASHQ